jgi:hypothetical protein
MKRERQYVREEFYYKPPFLKDDLELVFGIFEEYGSFRIDARDKQYYTAYDFFHRIGSAPLSSIRIAASDEHPNTSGVSCTIKSNTVEISAILGTIEFYDQFSHVRDHFKKTAPMGFKGSLVRGTLIRSCVVSPFYFFLGWYIAARNGSPPIFFVMLFAIIVVVQIAIYRVGKNEWSGNNIFPLKERQHISVLERHQGVIVGAIVSAVVTAVLAYFISLASHYTTEKATPPAPAITAPRPK